MHLINSKMLGLVLGKIKVSH